MKLKTKSSKAGPAKTPTSNNAASPGAMPDARDLYRRMLIIRAVEERLARSHQKGLIHGACHTYVGQEAVAAGICANLRPDDAVFSTHRGHGHALAKGMEPFELIAELYGRSEGCSRGLGGSMHLFAPEIGMLGTSGIVGPCILQATGAGYSFRLLKTDRVAVAFFGDGAVNNGAFHEGLNMASIWRLPVLYVCENNGYAEFSPLSAHTKVERLARHAETYGIPAVTIDGNVGDDLGAPYIGRLSGMSGGTVLVCGTAGRYAGFRMRRGTILILGDCEGGLGLEMVAGTLIVGGSARGEVGASMNRGTIILGHLAEFSEICFTRPRECRLGIARLIADQLPEEAASIAKMLRGPIWRRLGDLSAGGKGEIWTGVNA